ncbi:MAG: hypothetical protein IPN40_04650 [Uliginosibacterium sp.]|nr:hypothetical protein [Uliginosibacterium sp.]
MTWLLIIAFFASLLGGVGWIWYVWQTRFASKMMDYDSREMAFLAEARIAAPSAPAEPPPVQAVPTSPTALAEMPLQAALLMASPPPLPTSAQAATTPRRAGERPAPLLDEAGRVIYLDLKRGVGGYPIAVGVDIARLVPDTQLIPPRVQVDYLVCRKDFTPVVAIFLDRGSADPLRERALQLLKQSRIRVLRWSLNAPPTPEEMHQQIFRAKTQTDGPAQ